MEQFVTRFLLKETLNQLQSLQSSLECGMESTESRAGRRGEQRAKPSSAAGKGSGGRSQWNSTTALHFTQKSDRGNNRRNGDTLFIPYRNTLIGVFLKLNASDVGLPVGQ